MRPHLHSLFLAIVAALGAVAPSAAQTFTTVTTGAVVTDQAAGRSAHWIDYDRDGDLDLFVTRGKAGGENNILYRNDGGAPPSFTPMTGLVVSQDGQPSDGATWGDYDNDGDDDLFVVNWYGINNMLYRNDDGEFTRILAGPPVTNGGYSETASWGDYDHDGFLDLAVSNSAGDLREFLYHNDGEGTFSAVTTGAIVGAGGASRGLTWVDYDDDGDLDLFVANESNQNEFLFRNMRAESGADTFQRVLSGPVVSAGGASWSGSWGDYDGDGDLDLFVANNGNQANLLFNNQGGGVFNRLVQAFGAIVADSARFASSAWIDADNDGDLDLYVSDAYGAPAKNFYYRNLLRETGGATFERVVTGGFVNDIGYTYGFAWGDYDEDGDLDLFCARTLNEHQAGILYRNDGNANHWLTLDCRGTVSNGSGIGARIRVLATIGGEPVWQLRVIEGQQGYCNQTLQQHVGLGDAVTIDSLVIAWPSGIVDRYAGLAADRHLAIAEGGNAPPALVAPAPGADHQLPTMTFRWRRGRLGGPYRLQVATDSAFSAVVAERLAVGDTSATIDSLPNTTTLYWRVRYVRSVDTTLWSAVRAFVVGAATLHYDLRPRWNLVSVPVTVASRLSGAVFPGSTPPAYAYAGGAYTPRDTLGLGRGYWLRSDSARILEIAGVPLPPETLDVSAGWNLIGSASATVPSDAVVTIPPGIAPGPLFGYDGGYAVADSVVPFRGYWMRATSAGSVVIGAVAQPKRVTESAPGRMVVEVRDAAGQRQSLAILPADPPAESVLAAAPPPPPAGAFDARFASGSLLAGAGAGQGTLRLAGATYPVEIRWSGGSIPGLRLHAGGRVLECGASGAAILSSGKEEARFALAGATDGLPARLGLAQNYPNPFNPSTTVAVDIPRGAGWVAIDVIDLLGRPVSLLGEGRFSAGRHDLRWDAGDLPGGVYFCRLRAEGTTLTRRMLLLR